MALQINKQLTTKDGGNVESGSYVIFSITFPHRGLSYNVDFRIFRSLESLNNGMSDINILEIGSNFFTKNLTEEEFNNLTPIIVHQHVKEYLENFLGENSVEILI